MIFPDMFNEGECELIYKPMVPFKLGDGIRMDANILWYGVLRVTTNLAFPNFQV
jgi:hypothetical protein